MADQAADSIDFSSPVALHYQLRRILCRQIESGLFRPGDPFPTSRELRERYQVSTTTVEHALGWLSEHGLIYRKPGRGTVVSVHPVTQELPGLAGIYESAEAQGIEFENLILRAQFVEPSQRQAEMLGLRSGQRAFRLDRLNTIRGNEPLSVELGIYAPDLGNRFLAEPDTMNGSIYRTLETRFGLRLDSATQTIGGVAAGPREAELLGLAPGAPVIHFDRVLYLADGRPIQLLRCYLPAARYAFQVRLKRSEADVATAMSFGGGRLSAAVADSWAL